MPRIVRRAICRYHFLILRWDLWRDRIEPKRQIVIDRMADFFLHAMVGLIISVPLTQILVRVLMAVR